VVASAEVRIVPVIPTATYNPLEVVVEEDSSFSLQEKMMKLKRKRERIMSICFTWFPIGGYRRTQLYHQSVCFTRIGKVSAENTKYAEHYTSYGYSFRIYGNFAEILK